MEDFPQPPSPQIVIVMRWGSAIVFVLEYGRGGGVLGELPLDRDIAEFRSHLRRLCSFVSMYVVCEPQGRTVPGNREVVSSSLVSFLGTRRNLVAPNPNPTTSLDREYCVP